MDDTLSKFEAGIEQKLFAVLEDDYLHLPYCALQGHQYGELDEKLTGSDLFERLEKLPNLNVTLLDLSQPMLQRAFQRVGQVTRGAVQTIQGDIREAQLGRAQFDVVVAAAVLHHLRTEDEWTSVFAKLHAALKPGGTLWIYDLVQHAMPEIEREMCQRYARYLVDFGGEAYREHVFAYVEQEDTPRSLAFQLDQMRAAGFRDLEVLHKNVNFAAFGARK